MPDGNPRQVPPGTDVGAQLLAKFAGALAGKALGDVPEEDKLSAIEGLTAALEELVAINRTCASMLWDKFGDEEAQDFAKKPDLRDFMSAWSLATVAFLAEMEEVEGQEEGSEEGEADGEEQPEAPDGEGDGEGGPVIDAEFKVQRPRRAGK